MGFCADMVTANGDINRRLRSIDYILTHKQTHLDEVNYAVKSLNDLRDGTRITKVVEILFKGEPLSHKLRLPAISKLQKIHNVNLALTRISEHINIEGNISTRDIVNGHREKMLSLFWQLIYKYLTPRYNKAAKTIQHWWRNNNLKFIIIKRIRAKQIFKRHLAATKIQACVRGYLTRKYWPHEQAELIKNREKLHLASTKIKQYLQNKLKLLTEDRKHFIILRRTTVFVQRKFRSKIAMKKDRQQYIKAKQSALLIQKMYRGFTIRKNWPQIKNSLMIEKTNRTNAINVIKRFLRKNLPPTEDLLYYKKLLHNTLAVQRRFRANNLMKAQMKAFIMYKKSTIVIQQRFRAKQAMVKQKNHYLKLKMCVVKLQAVTRGYIMRKQWSALRAELEVKRLRLIICSNIIKRALRSNLPLTEDRIQFLDLKRSVIVVQNRFRALKEMKQQRQNYLQIKTVTVKLQSVARGYILRKQWPVLRSELIVRRQHLINCSNIIKRALRKNLPANDNRLRFLELRKATTLIQSRFRANRQMKEYQILRNNVIVIQRRFRANIAMKQQKLAYKNTRAKIIRLQAFFRGHLVLKKWPEIKYELEANKKHLIAASNTIKKFLRLCLSPTPDRLRYIKMRQAVVNIQARYRATLAMKSAEREYLLLKDSVIIIQRHYKAHKVMLEQKKRYELLKKSTVVLQTHIRGYLARRRWPQLKDSMEAKRRLAFDTLEVSY